MKKLTAREFIDQRFPEFKKITTSELHKVINGDTILSLMTDYHLYSRILERTSEDADNYDEYH